MAPPECLTCKPGDDTHHETAITNTGCEGAYQHVDGTVIRL